MSKIHAVVVNGLVTNMIVWDGISAYGAGGNQILIPVSSMGDNTPGIGWHYENGVFTAPVIEKTVDELARDNMANANSEYDRASVKIAAFNDRIADEDWSGTTEAVIREELLAWTGYRKSLRAYISAADWSKRLPESLE